MDGGPVACRLHCHYTFDGDEEECSISPSFNDMMPPLTAQHRIEVETEYISDGAAIGNTHQLSGMVCHESLSGRQSKHRRKGVLRQLAHREEKVKKPKLTFQFDAIPDKREGCLGTSNVPLDPESMRVMSRMSECTHLAPCCSWC